MRDTALRLLRDCTQAFGAPGFEGPVREIFRRELPGATFDADGLGGLVALPPPGASGPRVMLTAHMDEVGFMVQDITPDGFLKFVPLGGWNENSLLAQRVRVRTGDGREWAGVISSLPPHFSGGDGKTSPPIDKLFIDLGAESKAQVEGLGVALGDAIVPDGPFAATAHPERFLAKAFDNRAGVAGLIQSLQLLRQAPLPCQLFGSASVQEEVGCRGAVVAAAQIRPQAAIVLEGPPADDTPGMNRAESQGKLGGGVQIRLFDPTAIMNRPLAQFAIQTAKELGIPHQVTVRRSGGTDARAIQASNLGVPVVVLGTPARYIHTHQAMVDIRDQLALVALATAMVKKMDAATVASFTAG